MTARMFRQPGQEPPATPPLFPHKPVANSPPYRRSKPTKDVQHAIAAAQAREAQP